MLAEFKFAGEPDETFFENQDRGYRFFYTITSGVFNKIFFNLVPRGLWYGRDMIFKPSYKN